VYDNSLVLPEVNNPGGRAEYCQKVRNSSPGVSMYVGSRILRLAEQEHTRMCSRYKFDLTEGHTLKVQNVIASAVVYRQQVP
jgi:hypothetical protein